MSTKTKEHKAIVNYIANDLKINKEDLIKIAENYIERKIEKAVWDLCSSNSIRSIIKEKIANCFGGTIRDTLGNKIQYMIREEIRFEIIDKIKINEIGIDVTVK